MKLTLLAALCLILPMATARADPVGDEIAYLIDFVRHSPCTFIRNGSTYEGGAAADHIQAKYDYYKSEIRTIDDFIERAASKSILTGEPYQVRCGGKTMPASDWIRAEDASYRTKHPQETQ